LILLFFISTGRPGLLVDIAFDAGAIGFFDVFYGEEYWNDLAFQTNLYSTQDLAVSAITPHSRKSKWQDSTGGEIQLFMGLTIAMGLVRKDDLEKFWSKDEIIDTPSFR
jgi:hypothetical protein